MYASLMPDLIGIHADLPTALTLAAKHGFAGVDLRLNGDDLPTLEQADTLREQMQSLGLRPGYCSVLPNKFSADLREWQTHRARLEGRCAVTAHLGFTRTCAVVLPFHETLAYPDALQEHLARLADVLPVLETHGLKLGLEYVSPLTRRAGKPHPFVHDLAGMLELFHAAGNPTSLGVMLDSFHWHCAGESAQALADLPAERIIAVHLCDAIAGRPTDEQRVDERELPGASRIIDLPGFISALRTAGYDGPVSAEPTHPRWKTMDPDAACDMTGVAVRRTLGLA